MLREGRAGAAALGALLVVLVAIVGSSHRVPAPAALSAAPLADAVRKLAVAAHVLRREDQSYAAIMRQRERLAGLAHPGEHLAVGRQELAMRPQGLHEVVSMLAAEVQAPGVCGKRQLIMEKLEALLKRLGARSVTVNATDHQYRTEAESALTVW